MNHAKSPTLPGSIIVSTEPVVQCQTWVRARLLEMLMSDPTLYIPNIHSELDQQMRLVMAVADNRDEPLADAMYAAVWAVGLARREGIRLTHVFESRVRDLADLMLADTAKMEAVAPGPTHKTHKRTKSEQ